MDEVYYCRDRPAHDAYRKARDAGGRLMCVFDFPIRLDASDVYWDYPEAGGRVAFDDATHTATEYPEGGGEGVPRAYDVEEIARADQREAYATALAASAEFERASGLASAPEELAALQAASMAAEGIAPGDPWRQPTGAHDAYPLGAEVSHNGKAWESTIAANVWEPGVSGWAQTGGGIPDWVQPTGAHDAYALGAIVRHNGLLWESDIDANVWEPGVSQWTEIEEEPSQ